MPCSIFPIGAGHRAYDACSRPTGYAFIDADTSKPAAASRYAYDANGRFNQLAAGTVPAELSLANAQTPEPEIFTYGRLANSDLVGTIAGNAVTMENVYETNRLNLTMRRNQAGTGNMISRYEYDYDAESRRVTQKESGSAFEQGNANTFSYNTRGEVTDSRKNKISEKNRL